MQQNDLPYVLVNDRKSFIEATEKLYGVEQVVIDAEGVDLSRTGKLTLLGIQPKKQINAKFPPVYLFDMMELQKEWIHEIGSDNRMGLCQLLESNNVVKISFDCRTDSDALYHQFGIKLKNVLDCQVFHLGCRMHKGERPPSTIGRRVPFVTSLTKVAPTYIPDWGLLRRLGIDKVAPHKDDMFVWGKRPLSQRSLQYAANDCHLINALVGKMEARNVTEGILRAVIDRSQEYVSIFRSKPYNVTYQSNRLLVMTERPLTMDPKDDQPDDEPGSVVKMLVKPDPLSSKDDQADGESDPVVVKMLVKHDPLSSEDNQTENEQPSLENIPQNDLKVCLNRISELELSDT